MREMGRARPDPFVFGPNQARFLGGGGGGCGCGFVGSGRDETMKRFSKCERERVCVWRETNEMAKKERR